MWCRRVYIVSVRVSRVRNQGTDGPLYFRQQKYQVAVGDLRQMDLEVQEGRGCLAQVGEEGRKSDGYRRMRIHVG